MQKIRTVLREILGLFVDDGSFALAILVWLAIAWWVLPLFPRFGFVHPWRAVVLFTGLALILVESTTRFARTRRNQRRRNR